MKAKQLAFLEETIAHYNNTNRCSDGNGNCRYSPETLGLQGQSEGCAIGRKLSSELALELDDQWIYSVRDQPVFSKLPKELRELGADFLMEVQALHDGDSYWTATGLSRDGKIRVERIKEIFGL